MCLQLFCYPINISRIINLLWTVPKDTYAHIKGWQFHTLLPFFCCYCCSHLYRLHSSVFIVIVVDRGFQIVPISELCFRSYKGKCNKIIDCSKLNCWRKINCRFISYYTTIIWAIIVCLCVVRTYRLSEIDC